MKTSRILVAWLLSVGVFLVFAYLTFFKVRVENYTDDFWRVVIGGDRGELFATFEVAAVLLVIACPVLTLSFVVFAHVIPGGLVISLRGILLAMTFVAACLAFADQDQSRANAWLFLAFSASVTIGGLAWLRWQGHRAQKAPETN